MGIAQALFLTAAFAGAQAIVRCQGHGGSFISKPNIKTPPRADKSGLRGLGTGPRLSLQCPFPLSFGKGKLRVPGRSGRHRQPGEPHKVLWLWFRPPGGGGFTYRRPPYSGSKYGSWTCLGAVPGLAQRGTGEGARCLGLHSQLGGWTGAGGPALSLTPHGPRTSKGVSDSLACPGPLGRYKVPSGPGTREPPALAPCAGYLPSLCSYRGGARRAPGWDRRKRGRPSP